MGRAPCCDKANVKKGPWSPEEDLKLKDYIEKYGTGGNWIALPQKAGLRRCGKSCRLRWLNYLRPNIRHGEFSEEEDRVICSLYATIGSRWSIIAAQLPGRTDNDIKNYWNTKLKKKLMAFAAASSSSTGFIRTPAASPSKPPSLYSSSQSAGDQFTSLYNYKYVPSYSNSSTTTTTTKLKPSLMDKPQAFSCHQMVSSNSNTSSCLETSLSLFQNQQQYYKPLLTFGRSSSVNTDHQQTTSCSSTNSDNGGMINNKQQDAMRSYYNLDNMNIIANGFYEQDEYNKGFMLSGFEEVSNNDVFLSQFDNMINTSSSADAPALLDLYDIENGNRQLSMNINNLSLFDIVDTQNSQQIHQVVNSKINSLDHQLVTKEKDRRMMMMCTALINSNYEC